MITSIPLPKVEKKNDPSLAQFIFRSIRDAWDYRWAIETFVTNNLCRRYRRSALGFYWGLLGPLMTMITLSVVFSLIFHIDIKSYTVYIFTGLLPWSLISDSAIEGSQCFVSAESYLKKLFIPKLFFPFVIVGTYTVNFLFSLTSLLVIGMVLGLQWKLSLLLLPAVIAVTATLILGMTILLGVATVYFRDLTHILGVTLPGFFYTIPIIYPAESIPEQFRQWFLLNPFFYVIDLYRQVILKGQSPPVQDWAVSIALAFCLLFAGLVVLKKNEQDMIYRM